MKKLALYWLAIGTILLAACQKETSFELGTAPGSGSLQSDATGDCLPKTISGTYVAGTVLVPTVSTMTVSVNVTKTGTYLITTDTVNGYFFNATGTFTTLGPTNVTLRSSGTPFAAGINNFVVSYDGTICDIQVTVLPSGTGPATFTLAGAPNACTTPAINGSYIQGTPLTASNTVVLNVNVTVAGSYNVTTTAANGMTFAGTGTLGTGAQTITLTGTGTPATATSTPIPVTVGASTCTFTINVVGGAAGTLDGGPAACAPITVGGTYTVGAALTAANTVQVRIDVTTAGPYSITATSPTAGFSFAKTGTAVVGNDQLITLDPVGGPPTAAGLQTFTVTFGSSTCTFTITVAGAGPAVGTLDGGPASCAPITVNGTYQVGVALTTANTVQVRVDVTTAGSYTISTGTGANFSFSKTGTVAVGPDQLITLDAVGGPPNAAGPQTFTVTFGTSTCTFVVTVQPAPSNDYYPRTTNSNWSYEWDDDGLDSLYRTVIAATHTAAGNTYNIFMANDGTGLDSSGYYRKNGGDYFEWFDLGSWVGLDAPSWGEYIMLKDNVPAGTNWKTGSWQGTISGTPVWIRFSYTLTQNDVGISFSTTLGTMNYTNVKVVEEKIEGSTDGVNFIDLTADVDYFGRSYYARGIGLVQFEVYDAAGVKQNWQELRRRVVF